MAKPSTVGRDRRPSCHRDEASARSAQASADGSTTGMRLDGVPVRTIVTTIGLVLAALVLIRIIELSQRVLIWMAVAAFLAVALHPVVGWVQLRVTGGRRALATLLVFLCAGAILAGLAAAFVVPLARQVSGLADDLPSLIENAQAGRGPVGNFLERTHTLEYVQQHQDQIQNYAAGLKSPALSVLRTAAIGVTALLTIFVLAYLMVLEAPIMIQGFLSLFSRPTAERISRVGADCARTITGYLSGNLVISVVCGLLTYIFLKLTGVPFAAPIALFVAVADLIPLVGATLGAVVAAAAGFLHSIPTGIAVVIFVVVYQQLENHLLQPIVYARTVKLNPLTVVVAILVAAELAGVIGALMAIPMAAMIQIVLRDVWDHRRGRLKPEPTLGEEQVPVPETASRQPRSPGNEARGRTSPLPPPTGGGR
jgi:predicted PurR-regulated permease PerM